MTETQAGQRQRPEQWAAVAPDRAAVVDGARQLSYREWNDLADRLATGLRALAPDNDSVCVRLHQGFQWFVVNLALAKLGWEHLAINWRLTPHEVAEIVRDAGSRIMFLDDADPSAVRAELAGHDIRFVSVGSSAAGITSFDALLAASPTRFTSQHPATMVTYSSGTTGKPKGVRPFVPVDEGDAQQLFEYLGWTEKVSERKAKRLVAVPRTLITLPLHHGIGPKSAHTCHDRGGTIHLLDRFDPVRTLEIIARERITHWTTVPTMLQRIRALPADVLDSFDVGSMRMLALGSAPSSAGLKEWVIGYFGNCLYEGYGASETGMVTLMRPRWRAGRLGSCGRLRAHVSVRVVGPDGHEVPPGVEGELYVRTPSTIRNYVNQPPLDGETVTEDGYFRIGDVGKLDEDGFLYITGRAKDMIIAGGVNIFPSEIEQALADHPDVVEAAVIGVPEKTFGEQVFAFCEVRAGATVTGPELSEFVSGRLAPFKRPRRIELVEELPRNEMDKVVKNELRRPFWEGQESVI